jgi:hypothetical protein
MKLEKLQSMIRQLVTMEETTAPVLSCYVNLEKGRNSYRRALDERVRALRCTLDPEEREAFEMALSRVEAYLGTAVDGATRGVAIFAREKEIPVFQALGKYTFSSHLKWLPIIALGYAASIWTHYLINYPSPASGG